MGKDRKITQSFLQELFDLEQQQKKLEGEVKALYAKLEMELGEGREVSIGKYGVSIKETSSCRPSWKDEYKKLCEVAGKKFPLEEARIKASTEASVSKKLTVVCLA